VNLIPEFRRSLGEGNGNPLQYSCLENPMNKGAWQAIVHGYKLLMLHLSEVKQKVALTSHFLNKKISIKIRSFFLFEGARRQASALLRATSPPAM